MAVHGLMIVLHLIVMHLKKSNVYNCYVGHPISSDNGIISQILLLKSELYCPLHVAMGVAYSCLKYGAFITT